MRAVKEKITTDFSAAAGLYVARLEYGHGWVKAYHDVRNKYGEEMAHWVGIFCLEHCITSRENGRIVLNPHRKVKI